MMEGFESSKENSWKDLDILSTCSEASSVCDEERIKKLFLACDKNGDGYIDSHDLRSVCQELDMEDVFHDILVELGADENGMVSFEEFLHKRLSLKSDIRALKHVDKSIINETNMSSSGTSLGGLSATKEMWEFDSGAHDLSPIPNTLQRLIDVPSSSFGSGDCAGILELANKLHMAAVESLRTEVSQLTVQLQESKLECRELKNEIEKCRSDTQMESLKEIYEEQITELHSVIAELSRKTDKLSNSVIEEEEISDVEGIQNDVLPVISVEHSPESSPDAIQFKEGGTIHKLPSPQNGCHHALPNQLVSQEADTEYWKSLYQKEKVDSAIIEAQNDKMIEKINRMALLFAQNESSAYAYNLALQSASEVIGLYSELDSFMEANCHSGKYKRTKEETEIRKALNEQIMKFEGLLGNLTPFNFFSESSNIEVLSSDTKPNFDLETAILIQDLMQERIEKIETRQKLIQIQTECDGLRNRIKQLEDLPSNQCSGLIVKDGSSKHHSFNNKCDQTYEKSVIDISSDIQSAEKSDKIKLLENKFAQLVNQHSEMVRTLKKRIQFLENRSKET